MSKLIYKFKGVELDTAKRELRSAAGSHEISPLTFDTLEYLARHPNEVVSKDELIAAVWAGKVVTDASVTQTIRRARAALEECGAAPEIIRTQHGHGYRLAANVSVEGEVETLERPTSSRPPRQLAIVILALVTVVLIAIFAMNMFDQRTPDSVQLLEETQTTVQSTDAKVDELVQLLREQAAKSGNELDMGSENTIREALAVIVSSVDTRKQVALEQLLEGNVDAAAQSIVTIAQDLDTASEQSITAAAANWREAGAIYYTSNIDEAVRCFEAANQLLPEDSGIALDLAYAYLRAGRQDDALRQFDTVAGKPQQPQVSAMAFRGSGTVRSLQGEFDAARADLARAMTAAAESGDRFEQSMILLQQGSIAGAQGDNAQARAMFEEAVSYAKELGDEYLLAESLNNLGIVMAETDEFDAAAEVLTQTYNIHSTRHDLAGQSMALGNLGATALRQGDIDTAESYLLESVAIGERLGWDRSIALDLTNLGTIAASRQQFDLAQQHLSRALDIATASKLNELHAIILVNMGEIARDQEDAMKACDYWRQALPLLDAMQHGAAAIVRDYQADLNCP